MNNNLSKNEQLKKMIEFQDHCKKCIENICSSISKLHTSMLKNKISEKEFFIKFYLIIHYIWKEMNKYEFIYFIKLQKIISKCKKSKKQDNYHYFNQKIKAIERKFLKKSQDFMLIHQNDYFKKLAFWNKYFTSKRYPETTKNSIEEIKKIFNDKKILDNMPLFLKEFASIFLIHKKTIEKEIISDGYTKSLFCAQTCTTGLIEIVYSLNDLDTNITKEHWARYLIFLYSVVLDLPIKKLLLFDNQQIFELFKKSASFKKTNMRMLKTAIFSYWEKNYSVAGVLFNVIIENLIRNIVEENDGIIINLINLKKLDGYEYSGINKLLSEKKAFFNKFGPDLGSEIIFHLKIILISKIGQNWRNKTIHGIHSNKNEESIKSHWLFHTLCLFLLTKSDNYISTKR